MAMAADWSSLPSELVGLVADDLLATGDVDCYVSLRAVCHSWRDGTVDPRSPDPHFLPRRWVMLKSITVGGSRHGLFFKVDTGRFVRKELPVRRNPFVATDSDGLLIMPGRRGWIYALNPYTGASIRFPLYSCTPHGHGRVVAAGSSPMVVLYRFLDQEHGTTLGLNSKSLKTWVFPAKPDLDSFASVVSCQGCVYAMDGTGTVVALDDHGRMTTIVAGDWQDASRPSFLVDNAGELLAVHAPTFQDIVKVFRVDLEKKALCMIKSIGNRAIFLGDRSLSVGPDNLPAIEANCIYYNGGAYESKQHGIYMHRLEDGSHTKLDEPADIIALRPSSLQHVLLEYATHDSLMTVRPVI